MSYEGDTELIRELRAEMEAERRETGIVAKERDSYRRRLSEHEAARMAYASEFPPDSDGNPDVGSIHANIRNLKRRLAEVEAQLAYASEEWTQAANEAREAEADLVAVRADAAATAEQKLMWEAESARLREALEGIKTKLRSLRQRIRPNVEAASWVVAEIDAALAAKPDRMDAIPAPDTEADARIEALIRRQPASKSRAVVCKRCGQETAVPERHEIYCAQTEDAAKPEEKPWGPPPLPRDPKDGEGA